jgi:hypothetical protein
MSHVHDLPDGNQTGPNKALGTDLHDHEVPSPGSGLVVRTNPARNGDTDGHVHTVLSSITGPATKKK